MTAENVYVAPSNPSSNTRSFFGGVVSTLMIGAALFGLYQVVVMPAVNKDTVEKWVNMMDSFQLGFKLEDFWKAQQILVGESGQSRQQHCIVVHDYWTTAQEQWKTDGEQGSISGVRNLSVRTSESSPYIEFGELLGSEIDPGTVYVEYYPTEVRYRDSIANLRNSLMDACFNVKNW